MKTYNLDDLINDNAEVMREAEKNGVIIQECRTNGDVVKEFIIQLKTPLVVFANEALKSYEDDDSLLVDPKQAMKEMDEATSYDIDIKPVDGDIIWKPVDQHSHPFIGFLNRDKKGDL